MPWSYCPRLFNNWTHLTVRGVEENDNRHAHLLYLHPKDGLQLVHTDREPVGLDDGRIVMQLPDTVDIRQGGGERDMVVVTRDCLPAEWVLEQIDKQTNPGVPFWCPSSSPH